MSIAHRQPLNVRMQCTTPTVMHSGRRYKASRPLGFTFPVYRSYIQSTMRSVVAGPSLEINIDSKYTSKGLRRNQYRFEIYVEGPSLETSNFSFILVVREPLPFAYF